MWWITALSNGVWSLYGLMIRDAAVFISSAIPCIGSFFVLHAVWVKQGGGFTSYVTVIEMTAG
jgi:hypothetical protein